MGILAGLVRVELCFSYNFSNVLCVETNLYMCTDKATTAKVTFDREFLVCTSAFEILVHECLRCFMNIHV